MTRPVVTADVDAGTIAVAVAGVELDAYEVVGLIAELSHALVAIAPPPEPGWDRDPRREGLGGRIGQRGRRT